MQDFCPRINMLKGFFLNNPTMNYGSSKSAKIVLLKSIFYVKIRRNFFLTSIFEPLYFLKSCPIFDELALPIFSKYNGFLWAYILIVGQKSCFLGPTIYEIPQPNLQLYYKLHNCHNYTCWMHPFHMGTQIWLICKNFGTGITEMLVAITRGHFIMHGFVMCNKSKGVDIDFTTFLTFILYRFTIFIMKRFNMFF